ncbi:hypothetical protein NliqN6_4741 [Naganishia liquefaciens]|uniref:Uncharacterized protein n=1 Tax=Naganishia liquefaciens TaxID=104408 RepID=A0A8H3TY63_9TREE|nr:hypothetical protein NliqN6_4741 [Naganishia liquefaciens]
MGFSLQIVWHQQAAAAALPASGSGSSFTNFPVNQQTQHPRTSSRSPAKSEKCASRIIAENTSGTLYSTRTRYFSAATGDIFTAAEHISMASCHRIHATSSQKTKSLPFMPSPVAEGAHAGGDHCAIPAHQTGTDHMQRGGIIRRKLSKVKSLTEIPFPPYDRRGHTYPMSKGNGVDDASGGVGAGDPVVVAFSDAAQSRGKRKSGLSSFIRRKFSFDSLASSVVPEEQKPLISRAASPVISAPFLSESRWSLRESAVIVNSADRSRINGSPYG